MRELLLQNGLEISDRDFFKDAFTEAEVRELASVNGVEAIFARRSPSLKKLGLADKELSDDEIIKLIRGSETVEVAHRGLVDQFSFSPVQAREILQMRLQRLTGLERNKLLEEQKKLQGLIEEYRAILASQQRVLDLIVEDLRQIMERHGDVRRTEVVDEVVLAATTLSSQRTGAIVAIEREIGLRSYIETGITLDAELTYDLLVNVFHPATPLHDGAVIVQGNRVAAAACFLPLTVSPELSRALGSRHRAAIGLSEDTDAVAVVVSEETGAVSLVEDGQIRRGLDGPALRRALLSALGLGVSRGADGRTAPVPGGGTV